MRPAPAPLAAIFAELTARLRVSGPGKANRDRQRLNLASDPRDRELLRLQLLGCLCRRHLRGVDGDDPGVVRGAARRQPEREL